MERDPIEREAWPARALLLAALGAAIGLAVHFLTRGVEYWQWTENPARLGAAAALTAGGIVFAGALERVRPLWTAAFAAACGLVVGFVTYWNGPPDRWGAGEGWQLVSALLALVVAVPLFQASRDAGRWSTDYRTVHGHAWTNIVLWFAAWAFVLLSFLLCLLLSELFRLIGIEALADLIGKRWFLPVLVGTAFGAAVGVLRDRDRILDTLQRVVTAVLAVLAPVLALGLVLFVLALPFTGLQPLWDKTSMTTPILLFSVVGAVVLANASIGRDAEEEPRSPLVRWSACALAAVILPLALVASVSTAKRIGQYGFTPDRLWAAVFVGIAVATAAAYLWAVGRGRGAWPARLRAANIRIAIGVCALALFLALPILSFGALSTSDQLARLESGRVSPERFDWAALRFDFGPSGRRAVERLARSENPIVRQRARQALDAKNRWALGSPVEPPARAATPPARLRVDGDRPVPATLADLAAQTDQCQDRDCRLVFAAPDLAVLAIPSCPGCRPYVFEARPDGTWRQAAPEPPTESTLTGPPAEHDAEKGRIEVRPVERRQVFIDGKPAGEAF